MILILPSRSMFIAVNGRACRRRQAAGGDWPSALANVQAATLREDCRPEIASFSEVSQGSPMRMSYPHRTLFAPVSALLLPGLKKRSG